MKENLFLKLEGKTNRKKKPKFLNFTFCGTFCICSVKNGRKWCLCFTTSYFAYFWYSLWRKLTKSLALHGFGKIFTHAIWFISPDTPRFCSPICGRLKSPGFCSLYKILPTLSFSLSGYVLLNLHKYNQLFVNI